MTESELHGDYRNGIEIRRHDGKVDEVFLYRGGKAIVHIEQLSDQSYWMSLTAKNVDANVTFLANDGDLEISVECEQFGESNAG